MYNNNSSNSGGGGHHNNGMSGEHPRYQPLPLPVMPPGIGPPGNPQLHNPFPTGRRSTASSSRRQTGSAAGTLPLEASMQELFGQGANPFGRRASGPFPDGMGDILNRRDSLDSTTAVLDACILDLTRRRISMAMGGGQSQGGAGGGGGNDQNQYNMPQQQGVGVGGQGGVPRGAMDPSNFPSIGNAGPSMMGNMHGHHGAVGGGTHQQGYSASSIAAKQHLLQQQQLELEMQQKKLEIQRQQLLSGMQDFSIQAAAMQQNQGGLSMMAGGGGIGAAPVMGNGSMMSGSVGSQMRMREQSPSNSCREHHDRGAGNQPQQQWWICQVCNSKAFASRDEAMHHEAICQEGQHHVHFQEPQPPRPMHQEVHLQQQRSLLTLPQQQFASHANFGINASEELHMESNGPFSVLPQPLPLAMISDKDWLTPLHCFVRRHCVQVFCANVADVQTPSKGKRKPIQVGQVGIRCPHCHNATSAAGQRERGSVYYPTTISSIYNATMNLLQRHLNSCTAVPQDIMERYMTLKSDDARSGTSKKYWVESALSLGLVDTPSGIRFSALRPPPLPYLSRQQRSTGGSIRRNSNDFFSTTSNTVSDLAKRMEDSNARHSSPSLEKGIMAQHDSALSDTGPLVTQEDKPYATAFSFNLLSQMQPCVFTEADRLGKRKGLPAGFAGLACRHCFGGYGSGRFFPSSIKTLSDTSKTLNVLHNHMMRCRKCPSDVRDCLEKLRVHHDDERAKMKFGSQKAFFAKIWARLHDGINTPQPPPTAGMKRKMASYEPPIKMASYEPPTKMAAFEPPSKAQMQGFSPAKMQQMMNSVAAQQHEQNHQQQLHHHSNLQHHQQQQGQLPSNLAHLQQQMMGGSLDALSRQVSENETKRHRNNQM